MGNCSDVHKMSCFSKTQPLFVNSAFLLIPWFLIQRKEDNLFSMVRKLMLDLMFDRYTQQLLVSTSPEGEVIYMKEQIRMDLWR